MNRDSNHQKTAGEALVDSIIADLAEQHLAPDARETELLQRASAAADRIAELERLVAEQARRSLTSTAPSGRRRYWPRSAATLVLARCLGGIQMDAGPAAKNPVKQRAGQKSWAARTGRDSLKEA
jgi:hypothetical protein